LADPEAIADELNPLTISHTARTISFKAIGRNKNIDIVDVAVGEGLRSNIDNKPDTNINMAPIRPQTVMALLSFGFIGPILDDPDYLINVSANKNQMLIGVLFELILAGAVVGIAVFMFPILKKHNEALALGYVGARIFEGLIIIVGSITLT